MKPRGFGDSKSVDTWAGTLLCSFASIRHSGEQQPMYSSYCLPARRIEERHVTVVAPIQILSILIGQRHSIRVRPDEFVKRRGQTVGANFLRYGSEPHHVMYMVDNWGTSVFA